ETLWLAYAVMPLVGARDGVTLELGCGAGHASYLLGSHSDARELICTDHSFWALYLARKYMAPEASFIQLDSNFPLPFRNNTIDCIFGLDALHYVEAKKTISEEMKRVLRPKGLLLLLHLHNALQHNPSPGFPLAPQAWVELFRDFSPRAIADRRIIDNLLTRDQLDLRRSSFDEGLNAAPAMSIIASEEPTVFELHEQIREQQFAVSKNLRLNSVYRRLKRRNGVAVREFPTDSFAAEFPLSATYLPERIPAGQPIEGNAATLSATTREAALTMFKKFILVDLPPRYM
ncbi:MAG TPA: class I SAM-dependent methyltransferase, partial [Thermoplasmata archaeon]